MTHGSLLKMGQQEGSACSASRREVEVSCDVWPSAFGRTVDNQASTEPLEATQAEMELPKPSCEITWRTSNSRGGDCLLGLLYQDAVWRC